MPAVAGLEVEHRFVDIGDLRLHVAEAGAGEPLVLVHGWPQHWFMWRKLMPELATHYRLICPDLRGHGWSDAPAGGYDREKLAADILRLLDALGLERVRLIGHDWGGWAGFLICLFCPERVERFVALNIPPPMAMPRGLGMLGLWRLWYQVALALPLVGSAALRNAPGILRTALRGAASNPDAFDEVALDSYASRLQERARAHASAQVYRSFLTVDAPRVLAGRYARMPLTTPTLLQFGVDDPVIATEWIDRPHPSATDMRVQLVEGCGHFIAEDRPEVVIEGALAFFAQ
jgi:pimeloyl-ACP methyl ester carboxylesterase